jgi:hypothetical protein
LTGKAPYKSCKQSFLGSGAPSCREQHDRGNSVDGAHLEVRVPVSATVPPVTENARAAFCPCSRGPAAQTGPAEGPGLDRVQPIALRLSNARYRRSVSFTMASAKVGLPPNSVRPETARETSLTDR